MSPASRSLKRVVHREVKTHYIVSEMLECGHYYESLGMQAADPLIAKHRVCQRCAKIATLPPKKQPSPSPNFLRHPEQYEPPWKKTG